MQGNRLIMDWAFGMLALCDRDELYEAMNLLRLG
jgi:hypothetical protein